MKIILQFSIALILCSMLGGQEPVFTLKQAVPFGKYRHTENKTLELDGKSSGATVSKDGLRHPEEGITVMAVVKRDSMPGNTVEDKRYDAVVARKKQFFMGYDRDRFYVNFYNRKNWFAAQLIKIKITPGFHALAMTAQRIRVPSQGEDYLQVKLYFDSQLVASKNFPNAQVAETNGNKLEIGYSSGFGKFWHFGGEIADVRGFNRVLTQAEIRKYTDSFPIVQKAEDGLYKLTAADRQLLKKLPTTGKKKIAAAVSAVKNLARRTKRFDWRRCAEMLTAGKECPLSELGLIQYDLGSSILTVAVNPHYACPVSLFDTASGREYFRWNNPFFRVRMRGQSISPAVGEFDSHFIPLPDVPDGTSRFRIDWRLPELHGTIEFHCRKDQLEYTVNVEPVRKRENLETVEYPALELNPMDPDAKLFSPIMSGVENSVQSYINYELRYPRGMTSMQYGAFYDRRGGIFWASADPRGRIKILHHEADNGRVSARYEWFPARNSSFRPGCPARLHIFRGNWYDAAMLYRKMLGEIHALWFHNDSLARMNTPAWMRENTLWFEHGAGGGAAPIAPYRKIREYLDLPFAIHLYRWNNLFNDRDYPHHLAMPSLLDTLEECRGMGIRVMPYINGRLWETLDRRDEDWLYSRLGVPNRVIDSDGKPVMSKFGKADFAVICPYTEIYDKMMRKTCFMLTGMGADGIYIDQVGAAGHIPCYNPAHGHKVPDDTAWYEKGHYKVYSRIRAEMQAENPEAVLTTEDNSETCVGNFDGLLCWRWMYRGQVPAFPAVYSGRVQLFGLDYSYNRDTEASFAKAAWQLVCGSQLGWFTPGYFCAPQKHAFRVWVRQLMYLRLAMLPFFNYGTMARPVEFASPPEEKMLFWGRYGTQEVNTPSIYSTAWTFNGIQAVLLLNTTGQERKNTIISAFSGITGQVYCFTSTGRKEQVFPCNDKFSYAFQLPPHSFQLLLMVPGKRQENLLPGRIREYFKKIAKVPSESDPFDRAAKRPVAEEDPKTGIAAVKTAFFECLFFPGCMYPVRFRKPSGAVLPKIRWNDRIETANGEYFLNRDRWAERKILVNTPDQLVVECNGSFCSRTDEIAAPVKAVYRYTISCNRPEIQVICQVIPPENLKINPALFQLSTEVKNSGVSWTAGEMKRQNNIYIRTGKIRFQ